MPVSDGERIYLVDNGGILFAFDAKTGKQLWTEKLGTIQKSSPVLADGKLYVGTENGKFYIIRPHPDKAEILDSDQLGTEDNPEAIIAAPAVARGRVYVATMAAMYALGPKGTPRPTSSGGAGVAGRGGTLRRTSGPAAGEAGDPARHADRSRFSSRASRRADASGRSTRAAMRSRAPARRRGRWRD